VGLSSTAAAATAQTLFESFVDPNDSNGSGIAVVGDSGGAENVLTELGFNAFRVKASALSSQLLQPDSLTAIVIERDLSPLTAADISGVGTIIDNYINEGGTLIWICPDRYSMHTLKACIPAGFNPSSCPFSGNDVSGLDIRIHQPFHDSVVNNNNIHTDDLAEMLGIHDDYISNPPLFWPDTWESWISVYREIELPPVTDMYGRPLSQVQVELENTDGILTLILPRITGEPYTFSLSSHRKNFILFEGPNATYELKAGGSSWTDASLSLLISSMDGIVSMYAFDCTYVVYDDKEIRSQSPISLYYSPREESGVISSQSNTIVTSPTHELSLYAGEIVFHDFTGEVWTERNCFISRILATHNDIPLQNASVYIDGSFAGETDSNGEVPVRWNEGRPNISVISRSGETRTEPARPGLMKFMF
jgi:hypothetical protein